MLQINKCSFPYSQLISALKRGKGKEATLVFISSQDSWISIYIVSPNFGGKNLPSKNGGRLDLVKGINFHNNIKLPNR